MKDNSPKEKEEEGEEEAEEKKDDKIFIGNHLIVYSSPGCTR